MKICMVADSKFLTDGKGNFYSASNMRKAMLYPIAERCDKLYIICRAYPSDLSHISDKDLINHPKIEVVAVPCFKGIFGSIFYRKRILPKIYYAVEKSDVCVLRFGSNLSCMAAPIAKKMRKPLIGHVVGEFDMEIRKNPKHIPIPVVRELVANWMLKKNQAAFRACDIQCGVTKTIASKYSQPNREIFQLFDSSLAEECYSLPVKNDSKNIRAIFAGRLVKFKNIQNFLRAMAKARQDGVEVNVTVVGDGDFKNQLIKLAKQLNIDKYVEFKGRVESRRMLWKLYRAADIGFLLSFSEGLPLGAIEPMSVGLPLIAARLDYIKPLVTDGVEGFLAEPSNVDEISEKLKILALQPDLRHKMALAAYEKSKSFSAEEQAIRLFQLADRLYKKA